MQPPTSHAVLYQGGLTCETAATTGTSAVTVTNARGSTCGASGSFSRGVGLTIVHSNARMHTVKPDEISPIINIMDSYSTDLTSAGPDYAVSM